jgi:hypothetical protein
MTTLNDPVFGEMHDVYANLYAPRRLWQTTQTVAGFGALRIHFDVTNETITDEHRAALEHFLNNKANYKSLALGAILEFYQRDIYPLWKDDPDFVTIAPALQTTEELEKLLSYPVLQINWARDGQNTIGLSYECTWDVEHGTGVLFRDDQVVAAGLAEVISERG